MCWVSGILFSLSWWSWGYGQSWSGGVPFCPRYPHWMRQLRMRVVYLERFCNKFSYLFWFTWHHQPKGYFVEGLQHSAKLFHIGESRCICCVLSWIFIFLVQDSNAQDEDTWLPVRHPMAVGWMVLSHFVIGQQKHHQQRKVKIHLCLVHGRSIPIVHL